MVVEGAESIKGWRSRRWSGKGQRNEVSGLESWAGIDLDKADGAYRAFLEEIIAHVGERGKDGVGKEVFERVLQDMEKVVGEEEHDVEEEDVQELDLEGFLGGKVGDGHPKLPRVIYEVEKDVETREDQDNDDEDEDDDDDGEELYDPEYKNFWDALKSEGCAFSVNFPTQNGNVYIQYEVNSDEYELPRRKRGRPPKVFKDSHGSGLNQEQNGDMLQHRQQNNQLPRRSCGSFLPQDWKNSRHVTMDAELGVCDIDAVAEGSWRKVQGCDRGKSLQDALAAEEDYHHFMSKIGVIDDCLVRVGKDGKRVRYEESSSDSDARPPKHACSNGGHRAKGRATVPTRKMSDKIHYRAPSFDVKVRQGDASLLRSQQKAGSAGLGQGQQAAPIVQERKLGSPVRGAYNELLSPDAKEIKGVHVVIQKNFKSSQVRNHDQRTTESAPAVRLTKKKHVESIQHLRSTSSVEFRKQVTDILLKPYDQAEYVELLKLARERKPMVLHRETRTGWHSVPDRRRRARSYLGTYRVLRKKIKEVLKDKPKVLMLLRGFFFWLQHRPMEGSFEPWLDKQWLGAMWKDSAKQQLTSKGSQ